MQAEEKSPQLKQNKTNKKNKNYKQKISNKSDLFLISSE